ncbi:MAG: hypothetical protein EAX95_13225, partial [Candidatus Thorarchaeota archaeon]|nr:hypothetical protein [Candidatus Thorarchaeota archaeon]
KRGRIALVGTSNHICEAKKPLKLLRTLHMKRDSRSIAVLSILTAFVILLEVFPIVGLTDLKFNPGGTPFTLDWTGIPIVIIFLAYGFLYSLFSIAAMFIAIAYRNPAGAVFKLVAEALTMIGIAAAYYLSLKLHVKGSKRIVVLLLFGVAFRAVGMYIMNIVLLPVLYPYTVEAAIVASTILVPWNMLQAVVNILGGVFLFSRIPPNLATAAGFMPFTVSSENGFLESEDEGQAGFETSLHSDSDET